MLSTATTYILTGDSPPAATPVSATAHDPSDAVCFDRSNPEVSVADPEGLLPPPQPPPPMTTRLTFAPVSRRPRDPPRKAQPLVIYHILMDKAWSVPKVSEEYFIPPGSAADPSILI